MASHPTKARGIVRMCEGIANRLRQCKSTPLSPQKSIQVASQRLMMSACCPYLHLCPHKSDEWLLGHLQAESEQLSHFNLTQFPIGIRKPRLNGANRPGCWWGSVRVRGKLPNRFSIEINSPKVMRWELGRTNSFLLFSKNPKRSVFMPIPNRNQIIIAFNYNF